MKEVSMSGNYVLTFVLTDHLVQLNVRFVYPYLA